MTIYVVIGHTGEYSDHVQWLVRAFAEKAAAEAWAAKASARADELRAWRCPKCGATGRHDYLHRGCGVDVPGNEFDEAFIQDWHAEVDEAFAQDYTGTHYEVQPVEYDP